MPRVFYFSLIYFSFVCGASSQSIVDNSILTCDPLQAKGTNVLCTPPDRSPITDCSSPSVPGTIAAYACRNPRNEVLRGQLNCTDDGYWITSMQAGNTSLCNLDAAIINIQSPDVAVAFGSPIFTTPVPNQQLLQGDSNSLNDFQKVGLQMHNTYRRNHGVPFVAMAPLLNDAAQDLADFIAFGNSSGIPSSRKLSLINSTSNIEMNWYLQEPAEDNKVVAVSNAVQSWYSSGLPEYNWTDVGSNLDKPHVLGFARIVWKSTKFIGIGITNSNGVTFVVAIYTPGRDIGSNDPVLQFQSNVIPLSVPPKRFHSPFVMNRLYISLPLLILGWTGMTIALYLDREVVTSLDAIISPSLNANLIHNLSQQLSSKTCEELYTLLIVEHGGKKMGQPMPLARAKEISRNLLLQYGRTEDNSFDCGTALSAWNTQMLPNLVTPNFAVYDVSHFGETTLRSSLVIVGREDLERWVTKELHEIHHQELTKLRTEIEAHHHHNRTTTKKEEKSGRHASFLIALIISFCILALIVFIVVVCARTC